MEAEQFFQPLGVVLEASSNADASQHFVSALMRRPQVGGHLIGRLKIGDGHGEMMLLRQQDVLGAAHEISLVLFVQRGNWKRVPVPAEGGGDNYSDARRLAVPDAGSLPLDGRGRLAGDVIDHP